MFYSRWPKQDRPAKGIGFPRVVTPREHSLGVDRTLNMPDVLVDSTGSFGLLSARSGRLKP